jgi:hypothetical protein
LLHRYSSGCVMITDGALTEQLMLSEAYLQASLTQEARADIIMLRAVTRSLIATLSKKPWEMDNGEQMERQHTTPVVWSTPGRASH